MVTINFTNGNLFTKDGQRFEIDRIEADSIELREDRVIEEVKDMRGNTVAQFSKTLTGGSEEIIDKFCKAGEVYPITSEDYEKMENWCRKKGYLWEES